MQKYSFFLVKQNKRLKKCKVRKETLKYFSPMFGFDNVDEAYIVYFKRTGYVQYMT